MMERILAEVEQRKALARDDILTALAQAKLHGQQLTAPRDRLGSPSP
jgi:hypothetical protein